MLLIHYAEIISSLFTNKLLVYLSALNSPLPPPLCSPKYMLYCTILYTWVGVEAYCTVVFWSFLITHESISRKDHFYYFDKTVIK